MHESNLCKPESANLRGRTRNQLLVVQMTRKVDVLMHADHLQLLSRISWLQRFSRPARDLAVNIGTLNVIEFT